MTTPVYVSPFTGTVVTATDVSYYALSFSANTQLFWPSTVNNSETPAARIIDCVASTSGMSGVGHLLYRLAYLNTSI